MRVLAGASISLGCAGALLGLLPGTGVVAWEKRTSAVRARAQKSADLTQATLGPVSRSFMIFAAGSQNAVRSSVDLSGRVWGGLGG